jgi:hypothetical protein
MVDAMLPVLCNLVKPSLAISLGELPLVLRSQTKINLLDCGFSLLPLLSRFPGYNQSLSVLNSSIS